MYQVVLDTNVILAALKSRRGASNRLLSLLPDPRWQPNLSVPVLLEYEEVLKRQASGFNAEEIERFLDSFALLANHHEIFFLWRPTLPDANDELTLELAVASCSTVIITYNQKHYLGVETFGIEAVTPWEFLQRIGEKL